MQPMATASALPCKECTLPRSWSPMTGKSARAELSTSL